MIIDPTPAKKRVVLHRCVNMRIDEGGHDICTVSGADGSADWCHSHRMPRAKCGPLTGVNIVRPDTITREGPVNG